MFDTKEISCQWQNNSYRCNKHIEKCQRDRTISSLKLETRRLCRGAKIHLLFERKVFYEDVEWGMISFREERKRNRRKINGRRNRKQSAYLLLTYFHLWLSLSLSLLESRYGSRYVARTVKSLHLTRRVSHNFTLRFIHPFHHREKRDRARVKCFLSRYLSRETGTETG